MQKTCSFARIAAIHWCVSPTLARNIPETAHTLVQSTAGYWSICVQHARVTADLFCVTAITPASQAPSCQNLNSTVQSAPLIQILKKIFLRYIQNRINQKVSITAKP